MRVSQDGAVGGAARANRLNSGPAFGRYPQCGACGAHNHGYANCRYRNFVCSRCQRTGHLRRVCPEWSGAGRSSLNFGQAEVYDPEKEDGDVCNMEQDLHNLCLNDYKPVSVSVYIDNNRITMEVDTGTAISCISKRTFDELFYNYVLEPDNTILRFYNGSRIKPLGIIKPTVRYGNRTKVLELFVIESGTTSLLGRQWLAELNISIPQLSCNFVSDSDRQVYKEGFNLLDR